MDLTWFLITIAPVLILFACIIVVFIWATKAKPPAFTLEEDTHRAESETNN